MKVQAVAVYSVLTISVSLFVLYLGFMTHYYVLFYDGTSEMFEYYRKLQVLNKEGFSLVVRFAIFAFILLVLELHKIRPGLVGLVAVLGTTVFVTVNSLSLLNVIPKYKLGYLALDFSSMEDYTPSTFVFDTGIVLHTILIGLLIILSIVAFSTFVQRLREGKPIVRKSS